MNSHTRSTDEIEEEIEQERARLSENLEDLQNQFSIDGIVQQVSDQFRNHGGDIGDKIARTAKENPAALALTGLGLAWLAFGKTRDPDTKRYDKYSDPAYHGSRGSVSRPDPALKGDWKNSPAWATDDDDDDGSLHHKLAAGTEDLGDAARERVIAARKASRAAAQSLGNRSKKAGDFYDRQPLLVGAAAVAVGALIASAASRTKIENETLGAHRDRLFSKAEELLEAEKAKATEVLSAVRDEAVDIVKQKTQRDT